MRSKFQELHGAAEPITGVPSKDFNAAGARFTANISCMGDG
jgi:hypothetical protein